MVLNLGIENLFPHSKEFDVGLGKERAGAFTIIVSKDGTGDTDNIQDAISLLPSDGGVIFIKEGTYKIDTEILIDKANVTLQGVGSATIISTSTTDLKLINTGGYNNITIERLRVQSTGGTGQIGVYALQSTYVNLNSIWLDSLDIGIKLEVCENVIIFAPQSINAACTTSIIYCDSCLYSVISNITSFNSDAAGITLIACDEMVVTNNIIEGVETGVSLDGDCINCIVTSNNFSGSTTAISDSGTGTQIGHNIS